MQLWVKRTQHAALWHAGVQAVSGGGEVVELNRLGSVGQENQL